MRDLQLLYPAIKLNSIETTLRALTNYVGMSVRAMFMNVDFYPALLRSVVTWIFDGKGSLRCSSIVFAV